MGVTYIASIADNAPTRIGDFYQQLNRRDIFTDFTGLSSISTQWLQPRTEGVMGIWNFLYQVVLAKETALRMLNLGDGYYAGFTARILASLTVQDLWLSHVKIELAEPPIPPSLIHKAKTAEDAAKLELHVNDGREAEKSGNWQQAIDSYTEAMKIDNSISSISTSRALTYIALDKREEALNDAIAAARLNPKDKLAWLATGDSSVNLTRAKEAYQNAVDLSTEADHSARKKLEAVNSKINARIDAINKQTDTNIAMRLEKEHNDEKWDLTGRSVEFHSKIHERQVEGLIMFAERMKWPWVHEVREAAEDVYGKIRGGEVTPFHVVDWIFGLTLPGEWMALKIMSALILLTASVKDQGMAPYYDCAFITKQKSYHRVRNVLGRVLGCLPGVISLCGWIGPCPPLSFDPPLVDGIGAEREGRHIRVKARKIGLVDPPDPNDNVVRIGGEGKHQNLRPKPGDDFGKYVAEAKDSANWMVPPPPQKSNSIATVQGIMLKALPLESGVDLSDSDAVERNTEYRATIKFEIDGQPVAYSLFTNPVFASLPSCSGAHEIHAKELHYFSNIVEAEKLKEYTPDDKGLVIVNATGNGAEVLARAWCAERGKAAVIRRIGGPCFACTVNTVVELRQKVVIWVS
ncbi:hypothetical protein ABW20_dc0105257 [Dactylellina cionopaga]|nr:hypothetical protein ABW20_dc0105257 [Dactylellina cionopaga]